MTTQSLDSKQGWSNDKATALIVLADGTIIRGMGLGAVGSAVGEVCFNTAITGYQEILTDPSYAGQIITFTFPHIGNVGANPEDIETTNLASDSGVRGCLFRAPVTEPSNYRAAQRLDSWLAARGIIGLCGVDTRALTARIREHGMPNAAIAHDPSGTFDLEKLTADAAAWPGLEGMDLVQSVTCGQTYSWDETNWIWNAGFGRQTAPSYHIVAVDYGLKRNILRCLATSGCQITVVPAETPADDILSRGPDGIFLSNGPGDPAATGAYAVPEIKKLVASGLPIFGICLGHQMLAIALGANTKKMHQGHHGANHPVQDSTTGKVEITSMNHGFTVDRESLPDTVEETHVSLFDGSNCGLRVKDKPIFSVQYHPEASPGPQDSHYLFTRFLNLIRERKGEAQVPER
ncbi:carbamoyl-phosphate synthase small chain [bacterium MnTg02]|nr:carbamoyl-phosphate synthase small chain [bacterium MnTg02]